MPDFATCGQTLLLYLKARIPLITLRTDERGRALDLLRELVETLTIPIAYHTLSQGVRDLASNRVVDDDRSVAGALDYAAQHIHQRDNFTIALTEIQDIAEDTATSRQLLDVANAATERGGSVVIITTAPVWPRLQRMGVSLTLDPPNEDEMRVIIEDNLSPYRGKRVIEWGESEVSEAAAILAGVTQIEAENAVATFLAKGSVTRADLDELSNVKDRVFADISGLEKISDPDQEQVVGGLDGLRRWLAKQRPMLTRDLRKRNLRPPRGVLLVGVPGCGKSLSAKVVAVEWKLPLYRLDLANMHGQWLGQSEGRMKEALAAADRAAPCVLWIDEIEKGLAGAGSSNDGGASTRLLGHFLYWLQESRARVFVVATANDVSRLPPELFRRGRFDEMFFVDLPTAVEREEIIGLYVRKYRLQPLPPELMAELVRLSDGFTGADLDAAARDIAMAEEQASDHSEAAAAEAVADDQWRHVFANTLPLSRTNPEAIEAIRAWGLERAAPASGQVTEGTAPVRGRRSVLA